MWFRRQRPVAIGAGETARLARPAHVRTATQGDQTVLIDLERGEYYSLNEVGARIWSLVCEGASFPEIVDRVCAEYDVSRERGERDADMLLRELLTKALLERRQ